MQSTTGYFNINVCNSSLVNPISRKLLILSFIEFGDRSARVGFFFNILIASSFL